MKKILFTILLVLVFTGNVWAAGSAIATRYVDPRSGLQIIVWECTSANPAATVDDSGGIVTGIYGTLVGFEVIPDDVANVVFTGDANPDAAFNVELRKSQIISGGTQAFAYSQDIANDLTAACSDTAVTGGEMPVGPANSTLYVLFNASLNIYASACGAAKKFIAVAVIN